MICPRCSRDIGVSEGRFNKHGINTRSRESCPMSKALTPITGTDPQSWEARAHLVGALAGQLREEDPLTVWEQLTAMPADELQRLALVALVGFPVEAKLSQSMGWAWDLDPEARRTA